MAYLFRSRKDVTSIDDLDKTSEKTCGSTINLQRIPESLFHKLSIILKSVVLVKVALRECFADPEYLVVMLKNLKENRRITELYLDIRENAFNENCTIELTKLISRGVVKSLELPDKLDGSSCEDILRELSTCNCKVEVLNVSGSVLTEASIDCLEYLIRERVVTNQLVLKKCKGSEGYTLTDKDHQKLKKAEKSTRRAWGKVKMLSVFWFDYVEHADVDLDDLNPNEWEIVQLPPPPIYLPNTAGRYGQLVHFMIKNKLEKSSAWKLVNGRRRRRHEVATSKVRIQEAEVDELANVFQGYSLGHEASRTEHVVVSEEPIALTSTRPLQQSPGTSANPSGIQPRTDRLGLAIPSGRLQSDLAKSSCLPGLITPGPSAPIGIESGYVYGTDNGSTSAGPLQPRRRPQGVSSEGLPPGSPATPVFSSQPQLSPPSIIVNVHNETAARSSISSEIHNQGDHHSSQAPGNSALFHHGVGQQNSTAQSGQSRNQQKAKQKKRKKTKSRK